MKRFGIIALAAIALLGSGLAFTATEVAAQDKTLKQQLVGTWMLTAITFAKDSKDVPSWGPNPQGMLMFDAKGNFAQLQMRSDRAKFASKSRMKTTPEENKATVQGTIAYFGTYAVDAATKTITFSYRASTWPNQNGNSSKRPFVLAGNVLKIINTRASSAGGGGVVLQWRRAP